MLVLTRKCGEEIEIGGGIQIKVLDTSGGRVRLGITAPRDIKVHRSEVVLTVDEASLMGAVSGSVRKR
jgi:carbon storage regulator